MSETRIELRHIRYVIAASERGSFRRAGRALGIEPSAISRRIRDVEAEIGGPLFRRHAAGVELTEIGRRFLDKAQTGIDQVSLALTEACIAADRVRQLRIGVCGPLSLGVLPKVLAAFRQHRPRTELRFREGSGSDLLAALRRGEVDVAVVEAVGAGSGLEVTPLWDEPLHLAVAVQDRMAAHDRLDWEDVRHRRFIFTHDAASDAVIALLRAEGLNRGHVMTVERFALARESLLQIVAQGAGVTLADSGHLKLPVEGVCFRPFSNVVRSFAIAHARAASNPDVAKLLALAPQHVRSQNLRPAAEEAIRLNASRLTARVLTTPAEPSQTPDQSP